MGLLINLIPAPLRLWALGLAAAAALGAIAWQVHAQREIGRKEIRAEWAADNGARQAAALAESRANARTTLRRIERQMENQLAQDEELKTARRDAAGNSAAADQLRAQLADSARRWRDALGDPAAGGECAAAGDAIGVFADVLGRADRRAGILASYADAARAAGLKCQRDYDALTKQ